MTFVQNCAVEAESAIDHIKKMEAEVQRCLSATKMAMGDDTHYFRASLVDFATATSTFGDRDLAKIMVDAYLDDQKGRWFPHRRKGRKRRVLVD